MEEGGEGAKGNEGRKRTREGGGADHPSHAFNDVVEANDVSPVALLLLRTLVLLPLLLLLRRPEADRERSQKPVVQRRALELRHLPLLHAPACTRALVQAPAWSLIHRSAAAC